MTAGLQIWDSSGAVVLDTSTRVGTVVGSVDTGARNGSISVPETMAGDPLYFAKQISFPLQVAYIYPNISLSQGTLTWVYPAPKYP